MLTGSLLLLAFVVLFLSLQVLERRRGPNRPAQQLLKEVLEAGTDEVRRQVAVPLAGRKRVFESEAHVVRGGSGEILGVVFVHHDTTRGEPQDEWVQALKTEFRHITSHSKTG